MAAERMVAIGFAISLPAISGAEPWIGSYIPKAPSARLADCLKQHHIPVRIGVNAGSLEKEILRKYGAPTAEGLVESALGHAALLEKYGYTDLVLSMKCSNVRMTVDACRLCNERSGYTQHIGITESGTRTVGSVKSAIGIGTLLMEGIGDTIRVSYSGDPEPEVTAGIEILKACGLRREGLDIISCPTCGRTKIDLEGLANEVERRLDELEGRWGDRPGITVAVMGCAVNGPGEAREADYGVAGGDGKGLLIAKGEIVRTVPEAEIVPALLEMIEKGM